MSTQFQDGQRAPRPTSQGIGIEALISRIAVETSDMAKTDDTVVAAPPAADWTIEGIADNTRITTSFGEVPAQLLRKNDMLRQRDGSFRKIIWIDHFRFDEAFISRHPEAAPVRIRAGALRPNTPERDVDLSPCQPLAFTTQAGHQIVRARDLLKRAGVLQVPRNLLSYTQIQCEGGDTEIRAEGIWVVLKG